MRKTILFSILAAAGALALTACNSGGKLTLEAGAIKSVKGSPFVQVNQGGKSLVNGSGGVHGWLSVQAITAKNLSSTSGDTMILNKSSGNYH